MAIDYLSGAGFPTAKSFPALLVLLDHKPRANRARVLQWLRARLGASWQSLTSAEHGDAAQA
jgi:hypothetical protein